MHQLVTACVQVTCYKQLGSPGSPGRCFDVEPRGGVRAEAAAVDDDAVLVPAVARQRVAADVALDSHRVQLVTCRVLQLGVQLHVT